MSLDKEFTWLFVTSPWLSAEAYSRTLFTESADVTFQEVLQQDPAGSSEILLYCFSKLIGF